MTLDFVARQKIGGTSLTYHYFKQFPILPPTAYSKTDLDYIVPRVLELTYTSNDMQPWAADLGYTGEPFAFAPDRRAQLRAELDAYYAKLYGLTRDELRYILDPADTHGPDYPTETFRGLKANDIKNHGDYRTQRLTLAAWDEFAKSKITVPQPDWMDRPLILPTLPRGQITPALYRSAVVPHLLYQSGGRISFDQFRRAYWLLADHQTLLRYAKGEIESEATKWAKSFHDQLEKDQFISHLRGAIHFDLQFITIEGKRWLQLRRTDHISTDEHAIFDARLALLVADLWPSEDPITPLTHDEEIVINKLELTN